MQAKPSTLVSCVLLIGPTLMLLSACAGQDTTRTGFIGNYDGMQPGKVHTADLIYVNPAYEPARYSSVIVDPVEWHPAPNTPQRDPEIIGQLKADFSQKLTECLSKSFIIVPPSVPGMTLGPDVLRIRTAITNTRKANWWINAPVQVAGIGLSFIGLPGIPPPNPGGASEEMEVIDAQSGKQMVAIATYNNGMPWNIIGYYQKYGHARRAFDQAADLLREQLRPDASNPASKCA